MEWQKNKSWERSGRGPRKRVFRLFTGNRDISICLKHNNFIEANSRVIFTKDNTRTLPDRENRLVS